MFGAQIPALFNAADETVSGWPGMVVCEQAGERILQSMTWGFRCHRKVSARAC